MLLSRSHLGQHRSVAPRWQSRLLQSRGGQQAWGRLPAALLGRAPSRVREPRELRARTRQPQLAPFSVSRVSRFSAPLQGRCKPSCNMNLRLCVQALLLLWLSLTAVCGVPLMLPPDGKGLEEGNIRYLVQPRASRTGPGPWQGGRRKFRRQRPRLSHKGPMPF